MNQQQFQFFEGDQDKESGELISILKGIIAEQELKISELQKDLKKWQRKYKQEFFKESKYQTKINSQMQRQSYILLQTFSKELFAIQTKYDEKKSNNYEGNIETSLKEGLQLIKNLYHQLQLCRSDIKTKNAAIQQQSLEMQKIKDQMQTYSNQYSEAFQKSEEYEDKLLAEIRRQQKMISQLKK